MKKKKSSRQAINQLTANVGLFYVSYLLSKNGWNALPTSRNAKGPDIVIYSQDFKRYHTIQVKSLSKRNAIGLGKSGEINADFMVICRKVWEDNKPEVFVITADQVKTKSQKKGKERESYWLQYKDYEPYFRDDRLSKIGRGETSQI